MNLSENYPFKPTQGTTYSQRREQIEGSQFINVRNLVLHVYKKADNAPLMDYTETLGNRENVRNAVLQFELANGLIVADGTEGQAPMAAAAETAQQSNPPTQQQVPMSNPMPAPVAPPATPAQAAQVAAQPQQLAQDAPVSGATTKKRPGKAAANGAAVAPPPAPPPPVPASTPGYMPPQQAAPGGQAPIPFTPPVQQAFQMPPQSAPQQQTFVPGGSTQAVNAPQVAAPAPAQAASVPLSTPSGTSDILILSQEINEIGGEVERVKVLLDLLKNMHDAAFKEIADDVAGLKNVQLQILTCLHHLYLSNAALQSSVPPDAQTLAGFQNHLQKFIGNPQ